MELKAARSVPSSEYSMPFLQHMLNAMGMSYHKYGKVNDNYPEYVDAMGCVDRAARKYEKTGNRDFLVDVANYAMIEFMRSSKANAHFTPPDTGRDGRVWRKS